MLVAMDFYSKWPEVALCGSPTSSAAITFLTGLFDRFGLVEELVTNNGVHFRSSELQSLGIRHCLTALYSPQADAETERLNRVLKEGIKVALAEGKSFQTGVRQTLAAYRTTTHVRYDGGQPRFFNSGFPRQDAVVGIEPVHIDGRIKFLQRYGLEARTFSPTTSRRGPRRSHGCETDEHNSRRLGADLPSAP